MKIGMIEAQPGNKVYGAFKTGETHGRFPVQIPMHIIAGAAEGPTLVIQAGVSGLEIEPALILPQVVKEIDPQTIAGTLIVIPLMNTSGFEFEQVNSVWDNAHLNQLGRGSATGTVSQQMIFQYYQSVIAQANALIDIRTGAQWSYHHYAGVYRTGAVEQSKALALALGLPQVVLGQPADNSIAHEAATDGIPTVAAYIGGGPGLRDFRDRDLGLVKYAVLNAMRHLKMIDSETVSQNKQVQIIDAHTFIAPNGERGFTFMDSSKRGMSVAAGEQLGYIRHPFTGEVVEKITAPRAGVMVHAGTSWPLPPEDHILAIIGDLIEEVTTH